MKLISLISAVNQNIEELVEGMNLETDAVIVNQCDKSENGSFANGSLKIDWCCMTQRGVGLSRNTCIEMAPQCDIILFTDEDISYDEGYSQAIIDEYTAHPEADALLFNMRVCDSRRTYWNEDHHRVRFYNYGKFPAYSISVRRDRLMKSGVRFPLEFGGGAKYINGEDSVFLHDLLKAGIKIYTSTVCLGQEQERESTWFKGYNEEFFISRGALYVRLYGRFDLLRAVLFLLRNRYTYAECGFLPAIRLMKKGMNQMRGIN